MADDPFEQRLVSRIVSEHALGRKERRSTRWSGNDDREIGEHRSITRMSDHTMLEIRCHIEAWFDIDVEALTRFAGLHVDVFAEPRPDLEKVLVIVGPDE